LQLDLVLLVLLAAAIHATWNALVKVSADRLLTFGAIILTGALVSLAAVPFVSFPASAAWPYLAAAIVLHNVYYIFLILAYRFGDLSYVYPLMRGAVPLAVALIAALVANETPGPGGLLGLGMITAGILILTMFGQRPREFRFAKVAPALFAGLLVASFTVVDGIGVRQSDSPWDFIVWLMLLNGFPIGLYVLGFHWRRVGPFLARHWQAGLLSGALSTLGLWIVLYALERGAMAEVAALRETSVVFAAIIGAVRLKEPLGMRRVGASAVVLFGILILHIAR
jgi:drug/metabolite transporter (DMT)-like permease